MKKLKFASHANDKAVIFLFYRWTQIFKQRFLFDIRYLYERVFINCARVLGGSFKNSVQVFQDYTFYVFC